MEINPSVFDLKNILADATSSDFSQLGKELKPFTGLQESEIVKLQKQGTKFFEGKVRQCISRNQVIHLLHTDRLSAFDRFISNVPFKGVLLVALARYWYENIGDLVPHAYLGCPHERILTMRHLEPIKAEFIVRGYMAGSLQRAYQKGERSFCGADLVDHIQPYQRLPKVLLTPTNKADKDSHDESRTPEQLIEEGVLSQHDWIKIADYSRRLFAWGGRVYRKHGWLLVDTKYEFAKDSDGNIFLIDEFHTPDSSRLWKQDTYSRRLADNLPPEMFDKEIVRRYLSSMGFVGEGTVPDIPQNLVFEILNVYMKIAEDLWGKPLRLDASGPEKTLSGMLSQSNDRMEKLSMLDRIE